MTGVDILVLAVAVVAVVAMIVWNNYTRWKAKHAEKVNFVDWIKKQK